MRRAQINAMRVSQSNPGEGREWRRWYHVVKNDRIIRDDLVNMSWSFADESEVEKLEDEPTSACCSVSLDEFLNVLDHKPWRI